jgi:hypothetical protein
VLGVLAVNPELVRVLVVSCGARRCRLNVVYVNLTFRFAWGVNLEAFCRTHVSRHIYPISPLIFNVAFAGNRQVSDICWDLKRALSIPGGSAWLARFGAAALSTRRRTDAPGGQTKQRRWERGRKREEQSSAYSRKAGGRTMIPRRRRAASSPVSIGPWRLRHQCR